MMLIQIFAICNILPKCEFVWRGHLLMISFLSRYLPYWSLESLSWGRVGVTPKIVGVSMVKSSKVYFPS